MTWEVRAVTDDGTLVSVVEGVTVQTVHLGINGDEYADLSIPTLHADATFLDLFESEVQLWLDGDFYFWGRPARLDASRSGSSDTLSLRVDGLFSYFYDEVVGGEKVNHIVSPHEDAAAVDTLPNSWEATSAVELHAVVDNNWEFWHAQKAIQVNNSATDADAYIWQRYTVPAELDGVPFACMATCYISDDQGGSPPYGGPAYNKRGLVIIRLDSATNVIGEPKVAQITDDTPRNALVRLQTEEIICAEGDIIDVRLYAPNAWTAWRFVGLYDGRWEGFDGQGKAAAVDDLVTHAQDTALGKQDHNIGTDLGTLGGETTNKTWPWWRRDNIGEQIVDLADTFEFTMDFPTLTPGSAVRNVYVRRTVGTDLSGTVTLTKADFTAWGLGAELASSYSRVIRQGDGQGIARDEWWEDDPSALGGNVRELLSFAGPGETLARLKDNAEADVARLGNIAKLPTATITGDLAKDVRPGDRFAVDLDHGWAVFLGDARALAIDFDGTAKIATLHLEPVT